MAAAAILPRYATQVSLRTLLLERTRMAALTLRLDGPGVLLSKARHMWLRERVGFERQHAAFVGTIASVGGNHGQRVAGFSLTHPRVSDEAMTRPEQIWPAPPGAADEFAALTFHGGLLLSAMADAGAPEIGVLGAGFLSELAIFLAMRRGLRPVTLQPVEWAHIAGADCAAATAVSVAALSIWLSPALPPAPDPRPYPLVIGCVGNAASLRAAYPGAREVRALSAEAIAETTQHNIDLFYEDGPVEYPEWFQPAFCGVYLDLVAGDGLRLPESRKARPGYRSDVRFIKLPLKPEPAAAKPLPAGRRSGKINIGLIGAGRWALGMIARRMQHAGHGHMQWAADRRPEACVLARSALGFERVSCDPEAMLRDESTDVVIVATYHGDHADLAIAALKAGKHCYLDKPAAVTFDQFWALARAATASDKILHVGNNRRFAPLSQALREALARQQGPCMTQSVMRATDVPDNSWYHWPSQGSRVISNTCHIIDLAMFLMGDADPVEVTAKAALVGRPDENVTIAIAFADGSLASLVFTNRGKALAGYYERHVAACGDCTGEIDHFARLQIHDEEGRRKIRSPQDFGHRRQIKLFMQAVSKGTPPPVKLRTLLLSSYAALAADQSLSQGSPVRIPIADIDAVLYSAK